MKDGMISERGTHNELIALGGDYCQMLQFDQTRDQQTSSEVEIERTVGGEGGGQSCCSVIGRLAQIFGVE
jgi:hypothetical protein